jgi:hypothetical protein
MFERYTERARQVIVLAQDEARPLKHNSHAGVDAEKIRAEVIRVLGGPRRQWEHVAPDERTILRAKSELTNANLRVTRAIAEVEFAFEAYEKAAQALRDMEAEVTRA